MTPRASEYEPRNGCAPRRRATGVNYTSGSGRWECEPWFSMGSGAPTARSALWAAACASRRPSLSRDERRPAAAALSDASPATGRSAVTGSGRLRPWAPGRSVLLRAVARRDAASRRGLRARAAAWDSSSRLKWRRSREARRGSDPAERCWAIAACSGPPPRRRAPGGQPPTSPPSRRARRPHPALPRSAEPCCHRRRRGQHAPPTAVLAAKPSILAAAVAASSGQPLVTETAEEVRRRASSPPRRHRDHSPRDDRRGVHGRRLAGPPSPAEQRRGAPRRVRAAQTPTPSR